MGTPDHMKLLWLLFHFQFLWMFSLSIFRVVFFVFFFHPQQIIYTFTHQLSIFYPSVVSISFDMMIWLFRVDLAFLRCIPLFAIDVIPLYHHSGTYHITSQVHLAQSLATLGQSMICPPRTNIVGPLTYAIIIFFIVYELGVQCSPRRKFWPGGVVPGLNNHQGRHLLRPFHHNDYILHSVEDLHTDLQFT